VTVKRADQLRVGETLVLSAKRTVDIRSIEIGQSCKGVHLNIVRKPALIKHKGKMIPNVEGGSIIHSDGCYHPCTLVEVLNVDDS
jgi:hypothetical protein